jgi:hypothetical protein
VKCKKAPRAKRKSVCYACAREGDRSYRASAKLEVIELRKRVREQSALIAALSSELASKIIQGDTP